MDSQRKAGGDRRLCRTVEKEKQENNRQSVGISSYYLSHIFKGRTGMTFIEYLSGVSVGEAKRLCAETDMTINEISEQCGYMNATYFCKVFKRMTGMTISDSRKKGK